MLIFVTPAYGKKIYSSELKKAVPRYGYFLKKTKEVEDYIAEGLLIVEKKKQRKSK